MPSFEDLRRLIESPSAPPTVEAFLSEVAKQYPEFFSGFTLMRESQSLQASSPMNPRAIVFGSNARLVMTFNGDSNQAGYHDIELMQFSDFPEGGGKFELREITFDPQGLMTPKISEPNPAKCARCHGTEPKPLWEQYDNWPGAYGEDDDSLVDFDELSRYSPTSIEENPLVLRHRLHLKEFRSFVKEKDLHPRYKTLKFPEGTGSPVAPYIPKSRSGGPPLRPNLTLAKLLSELNASKVAHSIATSGDQCGIVAAPILAALVLDCSGVENHAEQMAFINEELATISDFNTTSSGIKAPNWSDRADQRFRKSTIQLLTAMGISYFEWSPSRNRKQWSFFEGFKDGSDSVVAALWPVLRKQEILLPDYEAVRAELYPQYYSYDSTKYLEHEELSYDAERVRAIEEGYDGSSYPIATARQLACKNLLKHSAKFSAQRLAQDCGRTPRETNPSEGDTPRIIKVCASCHDGSGSGPKIPFDDPDSIRADSQLLKKIWIRIDAEDHTARMPPERPLTISEYRDLLRYLPRK